MDRLGSGSSHAGASARLDQIPDGTSDSLTIRMFMRLLIGLGGGGAGEGRKGVEASPIVKLRAITEAPS